MVDARHEILGVYPDQATADAVVGRLREVAPAGDVQVRVGGAAASVASMKAEMREEADNTIVGPGNFGPFTEEMTKGVVVWVTVGALLGGLLVLPLGFVEILDLSLATRLVIAALVGVATGATAGFVAGGGLAAGGGHDQLAAERGVAVAVDVPASIASEVVGMMRAAQPLRLDLGSLEGAPVDTFQSEARESPAVEAARKVRTGES
jgi:hypothetical protein